MSDAIAREQVNKVVARITARPRDYLETVEDLARAFVRARDTSNAPSDWAAAEDALRRALGVSDALEAR